MKTMLCLTFLITSTFLLSRCPPSPPTPMSITITNARFPQPDGGLAFSLEGQGFTPNGLVNVRLFNVPRHSTALDFANGPDLPRLAADANGRFSDFSVSVQCVDPVTTPLEIVSDPPVDIYLYVLDASTNRVAINTFKGFQLCHNVSGPPIPQINCGGHQPPCK